MTPLPNDRGRPADRSVIRNLGGPGGMGPATAVPVGFKHGMRAFRHRDFRIFFVGALASNSGNWLQNLAVPYVLFELTGKSIWVGVAAFAQFIPSFLLGPLGGALADRRDRRHILLIAQFAMAVAAFTLWGSWALEWRSPYLILTITALTGVASGLMVPSWQAFVTALVPKGDLPSAVTLNSTQFNAARAIGPALAGLLIATGGPGWAFFLNGVSFVAVLLAIWMIRSAPTPRHAKPNAGVVAEFGEAVRYIRLRQGLVLGIVSAVLVAFFGHPITQFVVVFADKVYEAGPGVLGVLAAAVGAGAVLAVPAMSAWDGRVPRSTLVRWGLPVYASSVIAFGVAPSWPLGLAAMLVNGGGFLVVIATTNTALQMIVAEDMRGRVMSARVMGFTLAFPLGSLVQGALADLIGPQPAVVASGSCLFVVSCWLAAKPALLRSLDAETDAEDATRNEAG